MPDKWQPTAPATLLDRLTPDTRPSRLRIIGIDGRSRSGKTTLAEKLATSRNNVAVIHTDDVAWHHSFFDWTDLLITNLLEPLRRSGPPVTFVPQAWIDRGRTGSIDVPAGTEIALIEGVGAARLQIAPWLDAAIWVETPRALAMRRTHELDRDPPGFVEEWIHDENVHLGLDKPWLRATAVVSGEDGSAEHDLRVVFRAVEG